MSRLEEKAKEIISAREKEANEKKIEQENNLARLAKNLSGEFEIGFAEVLDDLKEMGIDYHAQFTNTGQGRIVFTMGDRKRLEMDFNNRSSYRYESCKEYGTMTYGQWDMDRFILWIYEKLIMSTEPLDEQD